MKGTLKLRTASLAAAAVMAAGLFAALPAAAETSTPETAQEDSGVPYDVANGLENSFRYKDGVPIYDENTKVITWDEFISKQDAPLYNSNGSSIATYSNNTTYYGIDVSTHQGSVDWQAVKNAGVQFAIIRCGYGSEYDGVGTYDQDDSRWYENVQACESLGIPYGVYLYSYAKDTSMASSEADHALRLLSGHTPTLPVYLDIEDTSLSGVSGNTFVDIAYTWCNKISSAGYLPGIYAYSSLFKEKLTDSCFHDGRWSIWVADYRGSCEFDGNYNMWQYSNAGSISGINGKVDLNYWYGEFPSGNNNNYTGWRSENGRDYWYENGVKQGTTGRGKEIYDSGSNAWYWLDANQGGAKAVNKDVYLESNGGKWVRYDANGHMVKGEDCQNGKWYYFEPVTGTMIKGPWTLPDGRKVYYDPKTGIMQYGSVAVNNQLYYFDPVYGKMTSGTPGNFWYTIDGKSYWYENWVRQGWQPSNANYRGKEIYDPASGAWYWLDSVQQGAKAVSKEVYQDSNGGKWVRYDANGAMIKGWYAQDGKRWYYDLNTGAMYKGWCTIDGQTYHFDETTGVLIQ